MAEENKTGDNQAEKPKKLLKSGVSPDVGKATQFQPGQSGNPEGKPKGTKHLSTHIQEMLNDEKFEAWVAHPVKGFEKFEGRPVEAIVKALMIKAVNGDIKAFDALAKYGYGTKVEVTGANGEPLLPVVRIIDERTAVGNTDPE